MVLKSFSMPAMLPTHPLGPAMSGPLSASIPVKARARIWQGLASWPESTMLKANLYEPRHEKTSFLHMRKLKTQISFAVTVKLISAFVFATQIVQSLYFLYPKFQASSHLLWLYSPACVGPRKPVFSQRSSYDKYLNH